MGEKKKEETKQKTGKQIHFREPAILTHAPSFLPSFVRSFVRSFRPSFIRAKVTGSFADVMGVMGPYWEGFSNTRVVNESFAVQKGENPYDTSDDAIVITQK